MCSGMRTQNHMQLKSTVCSAVGQLKEKENHRMVNREGGGTREYEGPGINRK